jgi:hypothetical protein
MGAGRQQVPQGYSCLSSMLPTAGELTGSSSKLLHSFLLQFRVPKVAHQSIQGETKRSGTTAETPVPSLSREAFIILDTRVLPMISLMGKIIPLLSEF